MPTSQYALTFLSIGVLVGCGGDLTLPDDGSPARLVAFSGNGQAGTVGSRLDDPLVVKLTDASQRPVAGAPVEFGFEGAVPDGQLDPGFVTTDSAGFASARVRLGTNTGSLTVEARLVEASTLRATFDLTALERERGKGKDKDHDHGEDESID